MIIIKLSDFKGFYEIPTTNKTEVTLQEYIDLFEKPSLEILLGGDLSDLFIADLTNGIPQTQIYKDIFDPFAGTNGKSLGIKHFLLIVVYYEYLINQTVITSQSGVFKLEVEAGKVVTYDNTARLAESKYNSGIETFEVIQDYIREQIDSYPDFDGKELKVKYSSLGI